MPDFRYSPDGNNPKVTSGCWAKEATVHQFPISKGIAGVHRYLNPGASRELYWHAIAAEWAYVIEGRCQTVVLEPSGASEINNFEPGDSCAKGHGHSIRCIGDKPCHFVSRSTTAAFLRARHFLHHRLDRLNAEGHACEGIRGAEGHFRRFPEG